MDEMGLPDVTQVLRMTDDNARALMMAQMWCETSDDARWRALRDRYLQFLLYAEQDGWFRNFMGFDRRFLEARGSEDCFGRCVWSLGFLVSRPQVPEGMRQTAEDLLRRVLPGCAQLHFLRARAYALTGLCLWNGEEGRAFIRQFAAEMADAYSHTTDSRWHWFEDEITYGNAALPRALLLAFEKTGEPRYRQIGLESLDFLLEQTFEGEVFHPVGCKGWLHRGGKPAAFDQQPLEAAGTLLACLDAIRLTGDAAYRRRARACRLWFTGRNSGRVSLIDPETGGCVDGLLPHGRLNHNQGAESQVAWMTAALAWRMEEPPRARGGSENT